MPFTIDLSSRTSIITGGARGIGEACARELARAGSNVAIFDLSLDEATHTASALAVEFGVTARGYACDVRDPLAIVAAVNVVAHDFGAVDHLVNNAGVQFVAPIVDFPDEKWELVRSINLDGVFYGTKAVWKHMQARKRGRIVNIASVHGLIASPFKVAYNAAKHGVVGITKTAAIEGAKDGITVNAICPGAVMTDLVRNQARDLAKSFGGNMTDEQALAKAFLEEMPTHRFIEPREVGELCAYLCSDLARSITGAPIPIDGGWTAH